MAVCIWAKCVRCGHEEFATRAAGDYSAYICHECLRDQRDREHREFIAGREGLTIEERLRDLEEFMYQHRRVDHSRDHSNVVYG